MSEIATPSFDCSISVLWSQISSNKHYFAYLFLENRIQEMTKEDMMKLSYRELYNLIGKRAVRDHDKTQEPGQRDDGKNSKILESDNYG